MKFFKSQFFSANRADHAAGQFQHRVVPVHGGFWKFVECGRHRVGANFQGGQLRAQYKASKAKFDESAAAYRQSVLKAFKEVSDALVARQKYAEEYIFNGQAVVALASSVELAIQRYLNGKSSYFEVLQAQQELYPAQRAQVQNRTSELISVVQLLKHWVVWLGAVPETSVNRQKLTFGCQLNRSV